MTSIIFDNIPAQRAFNKVKGPPNFCTAKVTAAIAVAKATKALPAINIFIPTAAMVIPITLAILAMLPSKNKIGARITNKPPKTVVKVNIA